MSNLEMAYRKHALNVLRNSETLVRFFSDSIPNELPEEKIKRIIKNRFPRAHIIDVSDISGGCGAMFDISVRSPDFKGLSLIKQHRLVTEALKEEIKDMHGLRIHTAV